MGASGGDMAMIADTARALAIEFPSLPQPAAERLRELLTDRVTLSNPLDFHTHIWFDRPRLNSLFSIVQSAGYDAVGFVIDCPPAEEADAQAYLAVIEEFEAVSRQATTRAAIVSSLPESLPAEVRDRCLRAGIAPLQGQREALEALERAAAVGEAWRRASPVRLVKPRREERLRPARTLTEQEGKAALAACGVAVPASRIVPPGAVPDAAGALGYPVAIKATGAALEHKSDVGGVVLDVRTPADAAAAAERLSRLSSLLLVEKMVEDGVAEILIGITADPQFGQLLLLGAGGVLAEYLADTVVLTPPFTSDAIQGACGRLRATRLLSGYRGRPPGDVPALVHTALACARYGQHNLDRLLELDLNPVIVRPAGLGAVAVDALVRLTEES
jgi:acetyl-CoA synthetase